MINAGMAFWGGGGAQLNNAQVFDGSFVYDTAGNYVMPSGNQFAFLMKLRLDNTLSTSFLFRARQAIATNGSFSATIGSNILDVTISNPSGSSINRAVYSGLTGLINTFVFVYDGTNSANNQIYYNKVLQSQIIKQSNIGTFSQNPLTLGIGATEAGTLKISGLIQSFEVIDKLPSAQAVIDANNNGTFVGADGILQSDFNLRFNANKSGATPPTDDSPNAYTITVNGGLSYAPFENL